MMADYRADAAKRSAEAREARKRGDIEVLFALLSSSDIIERLAGVQELGKLGDPTAVPKLINILRARDHRLKISALKSLAAIGDPRAATAVHDLAVDGEEPFTVRSDAAATLIQLGDRRGIPILGELLLAPDNPHPSTYRKWALRILLEHNGSEALPALRLARTSAGLVARRRIDSAVRALESRP